MAKYLLDTNIYLNFYDRYYRFDHFPSFWHAFADILNTQVIIPTIVMQETYQSQTFRDWITANYTGKLLNHKAYADQWGEVIEHIAEHPCYSDLALTDTKSWTHESIADGWLIAIAKQDNLTLVTAETKNPNLNSTHPAKSPKIPDIAQDFGIPCINMNEFFREINLKI